MAGYVGVNLRYEVTQTRLTFLPDWTASLSLCVCDVNKGALLLLLFSPFCSALLENLFRIRNLILPKAPLTLDQSAHLQISEQINTSVLQVSEFFFITLQADPR